jgi:fumarate hydratase class II
VTGYNNASRIAALMKEKGCDIYQAIEETGLISAEEAQRLLSPENLLKMGFTISDLNNTNLMQ